MATSRVTLNEDSQSIWQSENLEHLRYEYDLKPNDVVIDLGAYRGEWAQQIRDRYGCRVIAVEPTDNITYYHGEIINKAAWLFEGRLKFGGAYYYTSSFEEPNIEYTCFDVNTLLSQFAEIAVLKINIEGAEYDLLKHIISAGLQVCTKNIQVQFHLIEDVSVGPKYLKIAEALRKTHQVNWGYPFCWENWVRNDF